MKNLVIKLSIPLYINLYVIIVKIFKSAGDNILILLLIIIVGIVIITMQNFKSAKKEQGFSTMVLSTSLLLIVSSFGATWSNIHQIVSTVLTSQTTEDVNQINDIFSQPHWTQLLAGSLLLIMAIAMKCYSQNKLFILNINGYFEKRIETHHQQLGLSVFEFKEREIDFVRIYKKKTIQTTYQEILEIIEEKTKSFSQESSYFKKGYTGIAPIPFIMWSGIILKRVKIDEYFEFDKIETQKFYKLKKKCKEYPRLKKNIRKNEQEPNSNDVVLVISITAEIKIEQLKQFNNFNVIELYIDNPSDNTIQSREQLTYYVSEITKAIENVSISNKRIHLVMAAQSSLALEVGKRIDEQRMVEIICYHFDIKEDPIYPWGLIMNGENKGMLQ